MITRFNKIGLIAALLVSALSTPSNIALAQSSSSIWTGDKRPRAAQVEETPWITEEVDSPSDLDEILTWYRDHSGLSMKDACRNVAADLGLGRSEIYQRALAIWEKR